MRSPSPLIVRACEGLLLASLFANFSCSDHDASLGAAVPARNLDAAVDAIADAGLRSGSTAAGSSATPAGSMDSTTALANDPAGSSDTDPPLGPIQLDSCGDVDSVGLDPRAIVTLTAGGPAGALRFVYPYDGTVFPRGLAAPLLMWEDGDQPVDAVHLYIHSRTYGFRGCFKPEAPGRLTLPQAAWDALAAHTRGKRDPYQVELTIMRGSSVAGPIRESLIIAPGSLKGSVFYNSYSSKLGKDSGAPGGVVLRIPAGGTAEVFLGQRACAGCHAASADGSRLVTNEGVYALRPEIGVNPPPLRAAVTSFSGISADGAVYWMYGQLVETDTGIAVPSSGVPASANYLSFSPDGRWLTFVNNGPTASENGLALMRYDAASRRASERTGFPSVTPRVAFWPSFLPDDRAIVIADALSNDLFLVDVKTGAVTLLARAMGFANASDAQAHKTSLPYGTAELRSAFYPTVAPVSAGGYFWVYFDSPRRYGNMDTRKLASGLTMPSGINVPVVAIAGAPGLPSRQLWVSAIEVAPDGDYTFDRSAPAFYLPGQEVGTDNHRAFSALDPCRELGASCQSGTECCLGFCSASKCEAPPPRCSRTEEACKAASDCCDSSELCINGFCSTVILL